MVIERLKISPAGAKTLVRIAVDNADPEAPSLDVDAIQKISEEISSTFDEHEERGLLTFGPGYTLEVGTPGLDFPLVEPRHFKKNQGRNVRLAHGGVARILLADDAGVVVLNKTKKKHTVSMHGFDEVASAVVEVEFNSVPAEESQLIGLSRQEYELLCAREDIPQAAAPEPADAPELAPRDSAQKENK